MIFLDVQKNKRKTWLIVILFFMFITLLLYFISLIFLETSVAAIIFALVFSFISSWAAYYNSDKIILKLNGARIASREEYLQLNEILGGLSIATGLPEPKLYVIEDTALNAFATGRNPQNAIICITTGLLQKLDKYELEGVIAHELSHIKNYDILLQTVITVMVGFVVILSDFATRTLFWGDDKKSSSDDKNNGAIIIYLIGVVFIILSPIFSNLMQLAISRKREFLADATAVQITRNPGGLISALQKLNNDIEPLEAANKSSAHLYIVSPFKNNQKSIKKSSIFSTHPSIEQRIEALQNMK